MQCGDAAVAVHMQAPPDKRVDLEEQDVELVNFDGSVWLDQSSSRSLVAAVLSPRFFPLSIPADLLAQHKSEDSADGKAKLSAFRELVQKSCVSLGQPLQTD